MKGKIETINIKNRECYVYTPPLYDKESDRIYPVIYCNDGDIMIRCFNNIIPDVEKYFTKHDESKCIIVMIPPLDRNKEYTPWKSKNPFNKDIFYGNADEYIDYLVNDVKKKVNRVYKTNFEREFNYILGYSLGGLVSLYTMFKTDAFKKAGCVSSSLWYKNWNEFIRVNKIKNKNSQIFLYLGVKENRSRNAVLKTVFERTKSTYELLKVYLNENVEFKLNEGGHFDNVELRYSKAIIDLIKKPRV